MQCMSLGIILMDLLTCMHMLTCCTCSVFVNTAAASQLAAPRQCTVNNFWIESTVPVLKKSQLIVFFT